MKIKYNFIQIIVETQSSSADYKKTEHRAWVNFQLVSKQGFCIPEITPTQWRNFNFDRGRNLKYKMIFN